MHLITTNDILATIVSLVRQNLKGSFMHQFSSILLKTLT